MRTSPIRSDPQYRRQPDEVMEWRARKIVNAWAQGMVYPEIARLHGMTVSGVREVITRNIRELWEARMKWKLAEMRCRAMAMELRYLRLGLECPEDQAIEVLEPGERTLAAFREAGVETVNQLRSVDAVVLGMRRHFPRSAIAWAILKLDSLGLSHRLKMQKKNLAAWPKGQRYLAMTGQIPPGGNSKP